jgi:uncharacterized protein YcnI
MRRVVGGGATALLVVVGAAAAWGHASLDKSSVPAGSEQTLTARVPVEKVSHNVRIVIEVPAGFTVRGCPPKENWACAVSPRQGQPGTLVTWSRTAGVDAFLDDSYPFSLRVTTTPGRYLFEINQFYADGSVENWDGPPGSAKPAPVLEVTGAATPVASNSAPPTEHGPRSMAATPTRSNLTTAEPAGDDDEAGSGARVIVAALGVAALGATAGYFARRRRPTS